jgi:hypothetical protein
MKSTIASQRTLTHILGDAARLVLLNDLPDGAIPTPADYVGNTPVAIGALNIIGTRATNAERIDLPANRGSTPARVAAWAVLDADGAWLYSARFSEPFDVPPGGEPYLVAGDLVIED